MICAFTTTFRHDLCRVCLLGTAIVWAQPIHAAEAVSTGRQIYQATCVDCHGAKGEGTEEYDRQLEGDRSVVQLAELIADTMPADDPGSLTAEQSRAVAAYVHDSFYSAIARARNRPARIELARLTVRQYRRAVTDLIGSFRRPAELDAARGLQADYYNGRRPGGGRGRRGGRGVAASRIDARVDFDFGTEAPVPEIDDPSRFSIRWQGAIIAPETGHYEFVVRTENAARLWINDTDHPLVDAWVKSGDDTEYASSLFLIGGTVYPLRLEFSKAKQGVDDSDKQKNPPPVIATISLLWQRPRGELEPIPARQLSPHPAPEAFVGTTPFPPDDRSYGWERGTSVSKAWDQATTSGAIEAAGYIDANLNELTGTNDQDADRVERLRDFCQDFAERAFRRPLTEKQRQFFVDRQFAVGDPETAVKRVVMLVLKSPRFLFREVGGGPDAYDVAARLAFGLWDSIPDRELFRAAAEDRLATREQVAEQAERMLSDLRAKAKLRNFLLTWLTADTERDLGKDRERFPEFDAASVADLRTSLELFLDDVVWAEGSDFRRLLLSDEVFLNDRLAACYGVESTADPAFRKVRIDKGQRAGVLTHPYLMTRFADRKQSSPILRGVFLARGVLGVSLRPPPEAVAPLTPDLHPDLTTRERVTLQTKPANCMTCHGIINPLGFALEHFDAVGRYRERDHGKPINDTGSYHTRAGETVTVCGARALAQFLAGSEEAHAAFAEQLFHHLVQQPVRAYGPATLDHLRQSFAAHDFNIRELAKEVMVVSALVGRDT